ncbi:tetratricopeptide repeat protein, partial [bacterium]|nr:tetratricopeptide repeat protein [bacterium]
NTFSFLSKIGLTLNNLSGYFHSISSLFLPGYFLGENNFEGERYFFLLYSLLDEVKLFNPRSLLIFSKAIIIFIGSITCFGFFRKLRDKNLNEIYVTCYLLILFFSPKEFYAYSSNRYLLMLFPFLIYYFFSGMLLITNYRMQDRKDGKKKKFILRVCFIVTGILLAGNLIPAAFWIKNNMSYVINYKHLSEKEKKYYHSFLLWDFFSSACWIKENTSPQAVIMHFSPPGFYLYSKRKTVFFNQLHYQPRGTVLDEIKLIIKEKKVDYVVESCKTQREIIYCLNDASKDYVIVPLVNLSKEIIYKIINIPPQVKSLNKEGIYWYNEKKYDRAFIKFEKSIKIKPDFYTLYQLGRCYQKKKMFNQALQMYKKAISFQPNYEIAKDKQASILDILKKTGNK